MEEFLSSGVNAPPAENVVDEGLFTFLVNHEIHKAARLRYYLSIVCLIPDLPATEITKALMDKLAIGAIRHLRATDVVSAFQSSCLALLLTDAEAHNLPGIFRRLIDVLGPISQPLTFSAGGACYPQTAPRGTDLLQQAMELMARARAEGGNRLTLAPS